MVDVRKIALLAVVVSVAMAADYSVPEATFQGLNKGGFRVFVPEKSVTKRFRFNANINEDISSTRQGKISGETTSVTNGLLILEFKDKVNVGDKVNYWIYTDNGRLGYRKDGLTWVVAKADLYDEYPSLGPTCRPGSTTMNGGQQACVGQLIFSDDFDGPSVDNSKWTIEQLIPDVEGIRAEFNSYEAINATHFFKNGVLFLKPNPLTNEQDVRGTIDLTNGCTSPNSIQCYYTQRGAYYLPVVKSAKITSKLPFRYGQIDIRAKLPAGDWLVPIMQLETIDRRVADSSPVVVIAFSRGNDRLLNQQNFEDDIGSRSLYAGPVISHQLQLRDRNLKRKISDAPYYSAYHVYTLEWLSGKMTFFVDNNQIGEVTTKGGFPEYADISSAPEAPYDKEYLLSFGVAVGGRVDFPDGYLSGDTPKPWANDDRFVVKKFFSSRDVWSKTWKGDSCALQVDSVKIRAV